MPASFQGKHEAACQVWGGTDLRLPTLPRASHAGASKMKLDEVPTPRAAAVQEARVGPGQCLHPALGGQQSGHGLKPFLRIISAQALEPVGPRMQQEQPSTF